MSSCIKPSEIKRVCNLAHARTRGAERFGLSLSNDELDALAEKIQAGDPSTVVLRPDATHANRDLVACRIEGVWLPAVFDRATRSIVTWLPDRAIDSYRGYLERKDRATEPRFEPFVVSRPATAAPVPCENPKTYKEAMGRVKALTEANRTLNGLISRIAGAKRRLGSRWEDECRRIQFEHERAKNGAESKRLKRAMHKTQERVQVISMELGESPDARQLLIAAKSAMLQLMAALDFETSDEVKAVHGAIKLYLRDNEPMIPSDFEATS